MPGPGKKRKTKAPRGGQSTCKVRRKEAVEIPEFLWADMRCHGVPVIWPVQKHEEDGDKIHVYVKCDDAIVTVPMKDISPFPEGIDAITNKALVKLKNKKETLKAFNSDVDWCLYEMSSFEEDVPNIAYHSENEDKDREKEYRDCETEREDVPNIANHSINEDKDREKEYRDCQTEREDVPNIGNHSENEDKDREKECTDCQTDRDREDVPNIANHSENEDKDREKEYRDCQTDSEREDVPNITNHSENEDKDREKECTDCQTDRDREDVPNIANHIENEDKDREKEYRDCQTDSEREDVPNITNHSENEDKDRVKGYTDCETEREREEDVPNIGNHSENEDKDREKEYTDCETEREDVPNIANHSINEDKDREKEYRDCQTDREREDVPNIANHSINEDKDREKEYRDCQTDREREDVPNIANHSENEDRDCQTEGEDVPNIGNHSENEDKDREKECTDCQTDRDREDVPNIANHSENEDKDCEKEYRDCQTDREREDLPNITNHSENEDKDCQTEREREEDVPNIANHSENEDKDYETESDLDSEVLEDSFLDSDFVPGSENESDVSEQYPYISPFSKENVPASKTAEWSDENEDTSSESTYPGHKNNGATGIESIPLSKNADCSDKVKDVSSDSTLKKGSPPGPENNCATRMIDSGITENHEESSRTKHSSRRIPVPEKDRLYSGNTKIFIKKHNKSNENSSTGRSFDCAHACFFCRKLATNIQVHLEHHSEKPEIKEINEFRRKDRASYVDKKEIKRLQNLLRNKGDDLHNRSVTRENEGELIIARRTKGSFDHSEYGPCPECFEWIRLKENYKKHTSACPAKNKSSDSIKHVQQFIFEGKICKEASKHLREEVFPSMIRGQISNTAMNDSLIISLGEFHFASNIANKIRRKNYTSYRMRLAARLLHLIRQEVNMPDASFIHMLVVENFDAFVKCSLEACGLNEEEELMYPSTALKLGYDIARLAAAKGTFAIKRRDEVQRKDAYDFAFLVEKEWKIKVRRRAVTLLQERQFNKRVDLPNPQDIATLAEYLVRSLKELILNAESANTILFNRTVILTEARLLLYNRRRPGELEAFNIPTYNRRSIDVDETDLSLRAELTKLEKTLMESQQLVELRGKGNKRVPIILPQEVKKPLEFLVDPRIRRICGIKETNHFVFANTGDLAVRAGEALNIIKYECKLAQPSRILATNLRKHTATISQVMGLEDHQLRWLVNHMGHTEKVHLQHYRATSGLIERLDIAKIMLLQEKNAVGRFAGVRLQDITFEDIDDEYEPDAVHSEPTSVEDDVDIIAGVAERCIPYSTGYFDGDGGESDEEIKKKRKSGHSVKRVPWTEEEVEEIREFFKHYLDLTIKRKCPGMNDCMQAIHRSKASGGVLWKRNWETLKKKVSHMIVMKRRGKD